MGFSVEWRGVDPDGGKWLRSANYGSSRHRIPLCASAARTAIGRGLGTRLVRPCLHRLDDEHAVEAGVDQPIRDPGLDGEDPQSLARTEQHSLLDTPVRDRGHQYGGVVRLAVRQHKYVAKHVTERRTWNGPPA
jgi:hypothetical protein